MKFLTLSDFKKTVNEKLRILTSENEPENQFTKFEKILYVYNQKTKHNTTGRTPADIFIFAGTPAYNTQQNKVNKIDKLNENRHDLTQTKNPL